LDGNTGGNTFTDDTITPPSRHHHATITQRTSGATYIIQGQHVQVIGTASEQVGVRFGGVGMSVEGGESLKLAA